MLIFFGVLALVGGLNAYDNHYWLNECTTESPCSELQKDKTERPFYHSGNLLYIKNVYLDEVD